MVLTLSLIDPQNNKRRSSFKKTIFRFIGLYKQVNANYYGSKVFLNERVFEIYVDY